MYYTACRVLETADKLYSPGDVIPEFTTWDAIVQRAHLNQGSVERVHGDPGELPTGTLKADESRLALAEEGGGAKVDVASSPDLTPTGTDDRTHDDDGKGEEASDPYEAHRKGDIYSCPACEGSVFTAASGLKRHVTRVHGGELPRRAKREQDDAAFAKLAPPPSKDAKRVRGLLTDVGGVAGGG